MKWLIFGLSLSLMAFVSCGTGTSSTDDDKAISDSDTVSDTELTDTDEGLPDSDTAVPEQDTPVDEDVAVIPLTCADFKAGKNINFIINGTESKNLARDFILTLPSDIETKKGWPVIFAWHGYGDSAANFEKLLAKYVNNEEMPFILVTPEDANYSFQQIPPKGVDWDNLVLANGSIEAELFDAVLECLDQKWGVDKAHVHTTGFSAGSIASDSLGVLRGDVIASIATWSGAYFSDADNVADLGSVMGTPVSNIVSWPELGTENKYVQLILHGAEGKDTWGASGFTIDFNHMGRFDANYLTGLGHNVIICNHGLGHTIAGLGGDAVVRFFKDHPLGTSVSPYADELPGDYPEACRYMHTPGDDIPDTEVPDSDI